MALMIMHLKLEWLEPYWKMSLSLEFQMSSTRFFFLSLSFVESFCHFNEITVVNLDYQRIGAQAWQTTKHKSHTKHHIVVIIIAFSIIKYPILK